MDTMVLALYSRPSANRTPTAESPSQSISVTSAFVRITAPFSTATEAIASETIKYQSKKEYYNIRIVCKTARDVIYKNIIITTIIIFNTSLRTLINY